MTPLNHCENNISLLLLLVNCINYIMYFNFKLIIIIIFSFYFIIVDRYLNCIITATTLERSCQYVKRRMHNNILIYMNEDYAILY